MDMIAGRMDLAVKYGADVAIFVHNVVYWVEKNAANRSNFRDGRYWTYNSADALCEMYPLWSRDQIKRLIKRCAELGVIILGDYNEDRRDRTKWYTPSDEILELYGLGKFALCKVRNRTMQSAQPPDAECESAPPLPSIDQDNTESPPYNPPTGDEPDEEPEPPKKKPEREPRRKRAAKAEPEWQAERFERFWAAYPRDENRAKAVEQWDLLPQDKRLMDRHHGDESALLDEVAQGLKRHLACQDWREGIGIPHAFRWLRDRKWMEKQKAVCAGLPPPDWLPQERFGWD